MCCVSFCLYLLGCDEEDLLEVISNNKREYIVCGVARPATELEL